MTINPITMTIRAKKLGVLIRDARSAANKSPEECAQVIGAALIQFQEYEAGTKSPSLPELEILARFLNVPIEHFWGNIAMTTTIAAPKKIDPSQRIKLRQRVIGVMLKQARAQAGFSTDALAEQSGIAVDCVKSYEFGEKAIPLPHLEALSQVLGKQVKEFQEKAETVASSTAQQRGLQGMIDMPPELLTFVSKPINRPYLELAKRLSEMSVEKLRAVAEGLLEITL